MGHGGTSPHSRESFARHLLRASPVLLLVTAAVYVLSHLGAMRGFETAALDVWLKVRAPEPVTEIVLVTIDDDDYREIFGRRSPLDPTALQRLVGAVAAGHPRVIGVDLDTSDDSWAGWSPPQGVPTVWAREGLQDETAHAEGGHGPRAVFRPGHVLGRAGFEPGKGIRWGIALTPQDSDGVVRRYVCRIPLIDERGGHREADAFAFAIVRAASGERREASDDAHEAIVLNFAGDRWVFPHIAARDVLSAATGEGWNASSPLRDKIVIIGGTYRAARDEYVTPLGVLSGVHIVAQAVQSELRGGGIREVRHGIMTLLEILSGILLVWINYRFPMRTALLLSLVAMPLLTLLGSVLSFSSLAYWFNFVPALLGVWIHELIDHAREFKAMHDEIGQLRGLLAAGAAGANAPGSLPVDVSSSSAPKSSEAQPAPDASENSPSE